MRPIDADSLLSKAEIAPMYAVDAMVCYELIKNAPTLDVVPVVHGRWVVNDRNPDYADCTHCGLSEWLGANGSMEYAESVLKISGFKKFCPNCGAKMDER